jgi:drug/metabolite transporter (DMT)-like permease
MTGIQLRPGEPALLLSAAVYGVSTTVSVVALRAVRPADLLAVEIAGAAAMLLITAAVRGQLRRRGAWRQMLLGALVPGLAFLFGDLGLARTSASSGSLLLAAEPLLAVLLALAVLRERLSGRALVALVVGLTGGALVAFEPGGASGTDTMLGNGLVLLAVVAAAVFLIATRRFNDGGDGLNAGAWQTTGGALSVVPFVTISWSTGGTRLDTVGAAGWLACIAVVVGGAVGSATFNRGIARVPAARAGQLGNLTPVVGTLTAVAFVGDRPSLLQLVGGAAILGGLTLLLRNPGKPDQPSPSEKQLVEEYR